MSYNYNQAINKYCKYYDDWQKAMLNKINFFTKNNTYFFLTFNNSFEAL